MLGLYTVGYNLAMYVAGIITFSLSYAIVPVYVEVYNTKGKQATEEFLQKSMHYLLIGIIPVCLGFYSVSKNLFIVLASTKYADAAVFSPLILVATIMLGMNSVLNAGLYINKKSVQILAVMLSAVFINIILNIFLLPTWGVMGATLSTLLAVVFATLLTIILSYKYIFIRVNIKRILFHICLSMFMCMVLSKVKISSPIISLFGQLITGVLIIVTGVLFFEKEISSRVKVYIRGIIK
jgi:O-antigen/teichoic acid export membrane protein